MAVFLLLVLLLKSRVVAVVVDLEEIEGATKALATRKVVTKMGAIEWRSLGLNRNLIMADVDTGATIPVRRLVTVMILNSLVCFGALDGMMELRHSSWFVLLCRSVPTCADT